MKKLELSVRFDINIDTTIFNLSIYDDNLQLEKKCS